MRTEFHLSNCRGQSYDKFSEYELKARVRCPDSDYCVVKWPKLVGLQMRSVGLHLARADRPEEEVILHKSDKFKVEAFLHVLDFLSSGLKKRTEAYSWIENLAFNHVH